MAMRVALVGANGQLGSDLAVALAERVDVRALTHADIEVTESESIRAAIDSHRPDLVINTAAYHRVDDCEDDLGAALRVNVLAAHLLARACSDFGAALLHLSTDYVFSGEDASPRSERDCPLPINAYGISKLSGELAVRGACPRSYIVRTSGLYGVAGSSGKGGNFVETMLRLGAAGQKIRVVDDQVLGPTYTADLAAKIVELATMPAPYGVYHITAAGSCSWYEFARAIFQLSNLSVELSPQSTAESGARARRPRYSVLANDALAAIGLAQIRPWNEGLADYLRARLTGRDDHVRARTTREVFA
jgi:dTDP-4-dehydrorhamnose reductase